MTEHTVNREKNIAATESPTSYEAPTTANSCSSLVEAVAGHVRSEHASFHMPGHKGRQEMLFADLNHQQFFASSQDLTELPGLDDLSAPAGAIAALEKNCAALAGSNHSFVSVNGASAALTAAILACAPRGDYALVPRNAHRSVVNALCLARLEPIWYEPVFDHSWGFWGHVDPSSFSLALTLAAQNNQKLACALVVSPTYCGALSDIKTIAALTKKNNIPLIVDEAHGAHFIDAPWPVSAIKCGADAVAHSWHKTLPALTQTGVLHMPADSLIDRQSIRSAFNLINSSSPSYILMASVEQSAQLLRSSRGKELLDHLFSLSRDLKAGLQNLPLAKVYDTASGINSSHILLTFDHPDFEPQNLWQFLSQRGIFAEAIMGRGVLFMLGIGSLQSDVEVLLDAVGDFTRTFKSAKISEQNGTGRLQKSTVPTLEIAMPPHQAMTMPHETIKTKDALGRVSAQCMSPCPPGIPVLIPGQKITEEVLELVSDMTIVVVADQAFRLHGTRRN